MAPIEKQLRDADERPMNEVVATYQSHQLMRTPHGGLYIPSALCTGEDMYGLFADLIRQRDAAVRRAEGAEAGEHEARARAEDLERRLARAPSSDDAPTHGPTGDDDLPADPLAAAKVLTGRAMDDLGELERLFEAAFDEMVSRGTRVLQLEEELRVAKSDASSCVEDGLRAATIQDLVEALAARLPQVFGQCTGAPLETGG